MSVYSGPLAVLAATCTKTNFVFCWSRSVHFPECISAPSSGLALGFKAPAKKSPSATSHTLHSYRQRCTIIWGKHAKHCFTTKVLNHAHSLATAESPNITAPQNCCELRLEVDVTSFRIYNYMKQLWSKIITCLLGLVQVSWREKPSITALLKFTGLCCRGGRWCRTSVNCSSRLLSLSVKNRPFSQSSSVPVK